MAKSGRFSRTGRLRAATAEEKEKAKKEKKAQLDLRDGAKLPWPGVLLLLLGMILVTAGGLFLLGEITRPGVLWWNLTAGIAGMLLGLGLVFFPFGRWSNL